MVNKVILVGRLGKDPEVRHLDSGASVANFSLATTESYKDRTTGEKKETTDWHNIVLWRGLADVAAKYLHKGDLIYIEGRIKTRSWEKDGVTRYTTEIIGDSMNMLHTKRTNQDSNTPPSKPQTKSSPSIEDATVVDPAADDLPF